MIPLFSPVYGLSAHDDLPSVYLTVLHTIISLDILQINSKSTFEEFLKKTFHNRNVVV